VPKQNITERELKRIRWYLKKTVLTMPQIAVNMNCSKSVINSINKKEKIRIYEEGKRETWSVNNMGEESPQ